MKIDNTLLRYSFLFGFIIALDRITKYYAQRLQHDYPFNGWLSLSLHYNRGVSWGMLHSENIFIYSLVTAVIISFACFFCLYTSAHYLNGNLIIGELMVCAGALGNIIDRLCYKGVIDFIACSIGSWSWPVFNVADMFIVMGLSIMIYTELLYAKKTA